MGIRWRVCEVSLLVLFLSNFPRGHEGSDSACQPRSTSIEEDLDLRCDCPTEVVWSKLQDNCFVNICHDDDDEKGSVYHVQNITAQDGGVYQCECTSNVTAPQCFNVTVKIQITSFEASPSTVRVNSSFTLTCSAVGYPAPTQFKFINYPHVNVIVEAVPTDDFSSTARYTLTANSPDLSSGEYTCIVYNTMSHDTMSTRVMVHEPPTIVRVKNVTVDSFIHQQRASLECIVQSWNSSVHVHWIHHGGYIIKSDHKYSTTSVPVGNAFMYTLHIHNLQESDAGEYICLLTSSYAVEDSKIVLLAPRPESETDISGSGEEPLSCTCKERTCKGPVVIAVVATIVVVVLGEVVRRAFYSWRMCQKSSISNATVSDPNQGNRKSASCDGSAERGDSSRVQKDGSGDSDAEREVGPQLQTGGDGEQLQDPEPEDLELPEVVTKGLRKRLPSVKS